MARKLNVPKRLPSSPFPAFEQDEAFDNLRSLIQSSRPPVALIGAGASVQSGYPTWPDLLKRLQKAASKKNKAAQWKKNLDDINDAPWTAEIFARDLGDKSFGNLIKREFRDRGSPAEPHISLAKMPFPHFLTTNFDPCIERALKIAGRNPKVVSWHQSQSVSDFLINLSLTRSDPKVVYLHGRYDDPKENIILTESSYVSRYIASDDARRKLMAIFMTHPVVFIGFSMNDPDLSNLMREVTARLKATPPAHYAIMSYRTDLEREATRARMEGKFGVRPVFFSRTPADPNGDDYANLVPLLEALAGRKLTDKKTLAVNKKTMKFTPSEFDPEDPHKGRFSGLSEHNGRRVSVKVISGSEAKGYLRLTLTIEPRSGPPITGKVNFHLHPTFKPSVETVVAENGKATLPIWSMGAFTLGVEIVNEKRKYELDLATLSGLPLWFRRR